MALPSAFIEIDYQPLHLVFISQILTNQPIRANFFEQIVQHALRLLINVHRNCVDPPVLPDELRGLSDEIALTAVGLIRLPPQTKQLNVPLFLLLTSLLH